MTSTIEKTSAPPEGMFRELLGIHAMLRRDLARVTRLAAEVRAGHPVTSITNEVRELETSSPLWRLRDGCWRYCRFVHAHHMIEDAALFPMVRRKDPALRSVIDRLEEDHLVVHHITERIALEAGRVAERDSFETRADLAHALDELELHLLQHLEYEETSLGPLLSSWPSWPQD